ncbi:FMN-dependent NADH-azoreductase [Methylophaga sp.]|uniref:FMN-dependent NADH-azoreductase n=1 Tax=Methylophaga sp. TaxID=2024840 RepID=UPI003F696D0C
MNNTLLHINSSGRFDGSVTRAVSSQLVTLIQQQNELPYVQRDLVEGIPFVDEAWINANFTDADKRNAQQKSALAFSDELIDELKQASHIVIASPIYNFTVPAVLKAWIDQVARAKVTFRYTEDGPEGLLKGKKAYLVIASGGVPLESEMDFASPYLKQVMGFLGIDDVTIVNANEINQAENETEAAKRLSTIVENS